MDNVSDHVEPSNHATPKHPNFIQVGCPSVLIFDPKVLLVGMLGVKRLFRSLPASKSFCNFCAAWYSTRSSLLTWLFTSCLSSRPSFLGRILRPFFPFLLQIAILPLPSANCHLNARPSMAWFLPDLFWPLPIPSISSKVTGLLQS